MTTNIRDWLEANEPETDEEAYDLHRASHGEGMGIYEVVEKNGQLHVKGADGWLILTSPAARKLFRDEVDKLMPDKELGWEGGRSFRRGMEKD